MDGLWAVLTLISGGMAIGALLWATKLARELKELKRREYYASQRLDRVSGQIAEALEPVRIQLAAVAAGRPVSEELIQRGRLYHEVTAEEASRMIAHEQTNARNGIMIVDVRTPKEYAVRHVPGAVLIPVEELDRRGGEIPLTMEKVLIYCQSGDRSRLACEYLGRRGYTNLYNVRDGLGRWNGPIVQQEAVNLVRIQSKSRKRSEQTF